MSEFVPDDPSFYEDFLVEAGEHFELMEQNFLALEGAPHDLEVLNAIFRGVHTIKGASGFLGLDKVQALAHVGENVLDDLRKGRMQVSPVVMELLFETTDTLKVLVQDVGINLHKQGEMVDPDIGSLIARLGALKGGDPVPAEAAAREPLLAPGTPAAVLEVVSTPTPVKTKDKTLDKSSDTIRVSQAKLDTFMNTVAELIISKTMVSHIAEQLEAQSLSSEADALVKELRKASVYLDQVSKEIQASVLGIRMVPVKTIFTKFPRMLRDLAKGSGKKIELQMVGEDTEIDKSLIEELSDPLIHLIRNSADHGIELPDVRARAGKPETGTVVLRARHAGDSVLVEIEDDGKGIDPKVIRVKAVEKGIISAEKAGQMSDEEAINLVFLPGFSTAQTVTDISGRGVGMDVVKSNVRKLGGSVSVSSAVGQGSIFTIKLPLTLAIIDALLMRVGGQVFALPGTAVEETLLVPRETLAHLTRRKAINLRGEVLGVTRLRELLHFKEATNLQTPEGDQLPVVVVTTGGRRMGIIVDAFLRRQEMVIKPLAPYLATLPGISGASILGDGGVVLILDPAELMLLAFEEAL